VVDVGGVLVVVANDAKAGFFTRVWRDLLALLALRLRFALSFLMPCHVLVRVIFAIDAIPLNDLAHAGNLHNFLANRTSTLRFALSLAMAIGNYQLVVSFWAFIANGVYQS
jgi:hypothetical protein